MAAVGLQCSIAESITGGSPPANTQGEDQKKLDVVSNEVFSNALRASGRTGIIASEEEDVPVAVEETYSGKQPVTLLSACMQDVVETLWQSAFMPASRSWSWFYSACNTVIFVQRPQMQSAAAKLCSNLLA